MSLFDFSLTMACFVLLAVTTNLFFAGLCGIVLIYEGWKYGSDW